MCDVGQTIRVLADFPISSEESLSQRLLEPERGRDAAIDLGGGVFAMHVNLFRRHPVDVELGEADGVVNLKQSNKMQTNTNIFCEKAFVMLSKGFSVLFAYQQHLCIKVITHFALSFIFPFC